MKLHITKEPLVNIFALLAIICMFLLFFKLDILIKIIIFGTEMLCISINLLYAMYQDSKERQI